VWWLVVCAGAVRVGVLLVTADEVMADVVGHLTTARFSIDAPLNTTLRFVFVVAPFPRVRFRRVFRCGANVCPTPATRYTRQALH
jgi:hypothetical protein